MSGNAEAEVKESRPEKERPWPVAIIVDLAAYAGYYLSNILFLLLSLPFAILFLPFPGLGSRVFLRIIHRYARFLTHTYLPGLGICRIANVSGLENRDIAGPFVCVANHRGRLDALLLVSLLKNTTVLIKSKHAKFPMLAHLVRHCGFVSVNQSSVESVASALRKCCDLTLSGTNVLVFAEGARTVGARLRPFGSMAFKVAVERGIPIVPVLVHPRVPFMAKKLVTFFPRKPVDYRIMFLQPDRPKEGETAADLCDRTYRRMARELRSLDAGTEWMKLSG